MIHAEAEELLAAGAVLDDLAQDEREAYAAHRASCVACRRLEVELDHVLADLSLVVPERVPPPDLMANIRRAIQAEAAGAVVPARPVGAPPAVVVSLDRARERRASRLPLIATIGLAAAFGIVVVGSGLRIAGLQQDLSAAAARVASLESAMADQGSAMTVAMMPGHLTVPLQTTPGAPDAHAAVLYVPGSTASYIVASNMPATPDGHGYQLWYADAAGVHPLETVRFDGNGGFVAPLGVDLADSSAVMITLEQAGGAQGEPGPQVVFGEL